MTVFDLICLLAALATILALGAAGFLAARGHGRQALRVLCIWIVGAVTYLAIGAAVSFLRPQTVRSIGEPWCSDDWCLTVQSVHLDPASTTNTYRVDLLIESRAKRVSQRANGAWIYLIDSQGRRFAPEPSSAAPLDVLLAPGASVPTVRTFRVPAGVRAIGLVTGHGSGYCGVMDFLVIGESGCLFDKPAMVRING